MMKRAGNGSHQVSETMIAQAMKPTKNTTHTHTQHGRCIQQQQLYAYAHGLSRVHRRQLLLLLAQPVTPFFTCTGSELAFDDIFPEFLQAFN
ncbi:hypothetical protein BDA96_09G190100 [Sorghum bicolor]|uniref:Uncharacterized protein n=2 Tax=Sorghum bicolor TaxID=4558 RepID=A0A1Z5R385_SORBI|nr:hypothetical protein BDA96_09G190100 [Sorghum bicolor]OQU78223.1 hypothetical protein SORBI_3009G179950 [Sorghum bicolor]OQU78224.1 hypothetical protein SORBI_3009G179950 [Sorghum bicolor]OQU78225.1 hypothetical protein SORBI_3009G179950 [Sorghum bicolor]OQU78226.1 hypothetical protein SORBI_3009G179950 [Sorghum bicolor]